MKRFQAHDVMAKDLKMVWPVERVGDIVKLLSQCSHHAFPVVVTNEDGAGCEKKDGTFVGLILRSQIMTLLRNR